MYYKITFFDGATIESSVTTTPGYMEVDDNGVYVRLTDLDGNTYTASTIPPGSYSTTEFEPCALPLWADSADKTKLSDALEVQYKFAVRSGAIAAGTATKWEAEVALE
jgi:hypothetical protein